MRAVADGLATAADGASSKHGRLSPAPDAPGKGPRWRCGRHQGAGATLYRWPGGSTESRLEAPMRRRGRARARSVSGTRGRACVIARGGQRIAQATVRCLGRRRDPRRSLLPICRVHRASRPTSASTAMYIPSISLGCAAAAFTQHLCACSVQ